LAQSLGRRTPPRPGAKDMTNIGDIANMRAAAKAWRANAIASGETVRAHDKIDELIDEIERLQALLQKLEWKSIDKDNMEYSCRIPYNVMDEIRRALEPKP
jgi:hypothetical protein